VSAHRPPPVAAEPAGWAEPDEGAPRSGRRTWLSIGRTALAIVSVLVLTLTGYAYAKVQQANSGLHRIDALDPGASAGGAQNILLVGMDSRTDVNGNQLPPDELSVLNAGPDSGEVNTDTLIIVHIPAGGGKATGVSIPRDSWVSIPGYGTNKINSAFGDAKNAALPGLHAKGETGAQAEVDSDTAGTQELIKTVEQLTGITITHFATVNLFGFYEISNAIGGVPVCLKQAVNDPYSGAHFPAGAFTVQGATALEFVRQRHNIPGGSTDLEREQRQQAFLSSMAHKILSAGTLSNPSTLGNLIDAVQKAITVDTSWDLTGFATQMDGMSSGNVRFTTVPTVNIDYNPPGYSNESAVEVDPSAVQSFFANLTGTANTAQSANATGTTGPTSSSSGSSGSSGNSAITVDVYNSSGQTGLAATVRKDLGNAGYTVGDTGNKTDRSTSIIYYAAGDKASAEQVDSSLGGGITLAESSGVSSGHVWVYLGRAYSGPGAQGIGTGNQLSLDSGAGTTTAPTAPTGPTSPSNTISDAGATPCIN
jgi:LCP family protein required for cell wall assembly